MSGLAGAFFLAGSSAAEFRRTVARGSPFTPGGHALQTYADDEACLVVAGRYPNSAPKASYAELVDGPDYVVAVEGYVVTDGVDAADAFAAAGGRARWLLRQFVTDGERAMQALRGAYNVAIWDKARKVATIGTCAFGQRHLYSRRVGAGLLVASDLSALRGLSGQPFELDPDSVWMSLLYGGVYGRQTPLRSVAKLLPGTVLTFGRQGETENLATELVPQPGSVAGGTHAHLDRLDAALRGALRRLGEVGDSHALMIGSGVDSSIVAAYGRQAVPGLTAITQQMPGGLDESPQARRIASAVGIGHHVVVPYRVEQRRLLDDVARFVRIAEEPAYWNQLGPALLSLLESMPQLPHAFLTGAEGDFLFNYRPDPVSIARVLRFGLFRPVAAHVARRLVNRVTRHTYIVGSDFDLLDRSLMRRQLTSYPEAAAAPFYIHDYAHLPAGPGAQRHFLNNGWQNVRIISQFGREVGAEVLFPYMDDEVVAAVLALPTELKINKIALRLLLRRFIPASLVPSRKTGYWAHTVRWHYERRLLGDALDLMADRRTIERGVYDPSALDSLVGVYSSGAAEPRHHPVLWQLLVFETFCREFVDAQ